MTPRQRRPGEASALFVDLYELTMAQGYFEQGMRGQATFEVWVRHLPRDWGYLVSAGWPRVAAFAAGLHFTSGDIAYLRSTGLFSEAFLGALPELQFSGGMHAQPEGSPFFAGEPILEITAPLPEAQLLETFVLNALQLPILAATKAARCLAAARGRTVVDFAMRRTHGQDAAHQVARSSWLAGMAGTSNVEAGRLWAIPVVGTMAHSYVLAFASELDAFRAYAAAFPEHCVLLVDTYDVLEGVRHAAQVGLEMRARGQKLRGIRLDSGDIAAEARAARDILDAAGLRDASIFASGGLDEYRIEALLESGAPLDAFGVGTALGAPSDAPTLDIIYKLVAYDGRPVCKRSPGKATLPGVKQVWREPERGEARRDVLALRDEEPRRGARALLQRVMANGRLEAEPHDLDAVRREHARWLAEMPEGCRRVRAPETYPVEVSAGLGG